MIRTDPDIRFEKYRYGRGYMIIAAARPCGPSVSHLMGRGVVATKADAERTVETIGRVIEAAREADDEFDFLRTLIRERLPLDWPCGNLTTLYDACQIRQPRRRT